MIKSARVMKKAVGHLIPFMEKEREERAAKMKELGLEMAEEVELVHTFVTTIYQSRRFRVDIWVLSS